jgi:hypothetical protein
MRFRITIRGEGTEIRGYATIEAMAALTAPPGEQPYVVAASPAEDDYDPFAISQPEYPPTPDASIDIIRGMWESSESPEDFLTNMAMMHFAQANVIRGERGRAERAEKAIGMVDDEYHRMMVGRVDEAEGEADRLRAELRDRELHHFETEHKIEQIMAIRSNFPEKCEVHDDDDVTCGWKHMVAGIDKALEGVEFQDPEALAIANALSDNWESGDLAGAVNDAIGFLRAIGGEK